MKCVSLIFGRTKSIGESTEDTNHSKKVGIFGKDRQKSSKISAKKNLQETLLKKTREVLCRNNGATPVLDNEQSRSTADSKEKINENSASKKSLSENKKSVDHHKQSKGKPKRRVKSKRRNDAVKHSSDNSVQSKPVLPSVQAVLLKEVRRRIDTTFHSMLGYAEDLKAGDEDDHDFKKAIGDYCSEIDETLSRYYDFESSPTDGKSEFEINEINGIEKDLKKINEMLKGVKRFLEDVQKDRVSSGKKNFMRSIPGYLITATESWSLPGPEVTPSRIYDVASEIYQNWSNSRQQSKDSILNGLQYATRAFDQVLVSTKLGKADWKGFERDELEASCEKLKVLYEIMSSTSYYDTGPDKGSFVAAYREAHALLQAMGPDAQKSVTTKKKRVQSLGNKVVASKDFTKNETVKNVDAKSQAPKKADVKNGKPAMVEKFSGFQNNGLDPRKKNTKKITLVENKEAANTIESGLTPKKGTPPRFTIDKSPFGGGIQLELDAHRTFLAEGISERLVFWTRQLDAREYSTPVYDAERVLDSVKSYLLAVEWVEGCYVGSRIPLEVEGQIKNMKKWAKGGMKEVKKFMGTLEVVEGDDPEKWGADMNKFVKLLEKLKGALLEPSLTS
ncbi:hypothetical protein [Rhizobacter sp. OV335]|uniref:hypothetical protein n=1 Tax=Rhizobacter sp. OV335 TaxID=1500264 RepID=UPI00091406FC|nr:hypothetical protein [Rhizobacter sp. OV335]SHN21981.1 hypothetical protein SAMN02787076_04170 [Rhizobacter sp. OV335]